ncbi:hypothetical protein [Streptomyces sp. CC53]|uniref:hypothetical protein n=1 Tax=Streptomyces sp. CC53 TaxID=1906740 RepID=UPI00115F86C8|nr:hypothetical protein [Streptomyces sp. CC53]
MPDNPMVKLDGQSAYGLDLEMSLLLPSSAPAPWCAAVHEAACFLADRPWEGDSRASVDLTTLSLLLFARTYAGDRVPRDVPVAELYEALDSPMDQEPRIVDEIDRALAEAGQGYDPAAMRSTPLWSIFNAARDRYAGRLGGSALADDVEPPAPGPSPMRAAAGRLAQLLADYPAEAREQTTAPQVAPGPLVIESDRIQIVTAGSIMPLRCLQNDPVRTVRVDGPEATKECDEGHISAHWSLEAARVRMAVARATGARPSVQGRFELQELLIVSTDLPRHSDPRQANVFLRGPEHPVVGRDGVFEQIGRVIDGRR